MGGKVGGFGGVERPTELDMQQPAEQAGATRQTPTIPINGEDVKVRLVASDDERPARLTAPPDKKLMPPGLDKSGPGNSENAPGHNKAEPPPPPPPPEPVRHAVEHQHQVHQ